jgi:hypothetical protein
MNRRFIALRPRVDTIARLTTSFFMVASLAACASSGAPEPEPVSVKASAIEICDDGVCPESCGPCIPNPTSPLGGYQFCTRAIGRPLRHACTPDAPPPAGVTCTLSVSGGIFTQKCCAGAGAGATGCGFTPCPP